MPAALEQPGRLRHLELAALDHFGTQKLTPENESEASRVGMFGAVCSLQAIGNPLGQIQLQDRRQS